MPKGKSAIPSFLARYSAAFSIVGASVALATFVIHDDLQIDLEDNTRSIVTAREKLEARLEADSLRDDLDLIATGIERSQIVTSQMGLDALRINALQAPRVELLLKSDQELLDATERYRVQSGIDRAPLRKSAQQSKDAINAALRAADCAERVEPYGFLPLEQRKEEVGRSEPGCSYALQLTFGQLPVLRGLERFLLTDYVRSVYVEADQHFVAKQKSLRTYALIAKVLFVFGWMLTLIKPISDLEDRSKRRSRRYQYY